MTVAPQHLSVAPNLALDTEVRARMAAGEDIVHLGFGESRLPVHPMLTNAFRAGGEKTAYGPVPGRHGARAAVAGYFDRRDLPTDPEQVVLAPGSKPLLMALIAAVAGAVILCRPSWVTYRPQARLFGREVITVPTARECGGVPDPDALRERVQEARSRGIDPGLLILTSPDNPTGTVASPDLVARLCRTARDEGILIVSDEIYRDLLHDPNARFVSPAELAPENTVVTTGLSKNHALGGWRIGVARFPVGAWGTRLRADVVAIASEVWSCAPGPMQDVAQVAFAEPPEIVAHLRTCARLHAEVSASVYEVFRRIGASCLPPQGGFYVYPDLEPLRDVLAGRGITDSASLQRVLLDEFGLAVLGGHHFGDDPRALRFRVATSLLYGDSTLEREESIAAPRPLELPHIAKNISRIEERLRELTLQDTGEVGRY